MSDGRIDHKVGSGKQNPVSPDHLKFTRLDFTRLDFTRLDLIVSGIGLSFPKVSSRNGGHIMLQHHVLQHNAAVTAETVLR